MESQITQCLTKSKYKNPAATKKDILDVLRMYKALSYRTENFVFNDGSSKDLFTLQGTIPVCYKKNYYHIPICLWLMDTHPAHAPICYVKPTADMQIRVSMYTDHNGKIYLPYLHDWKQGESELLGLIQVMIVTFGEYPPVYAKTKENVTPYPTQSYMPQPQTFTPYPNVSNPGTTAYPPYPTTNFGGFPPYPPANPNAAAGPNTQGPYPPYPVYPPQPSGYNANYPPPTSTVGANQGTITEEHIKMSLISAVEDKLRRRIQEKENQSQAEIQTLRRTKMELVEGKTKIDSIIFKLQKEEAELRQSIRILKDKDQELTRTLETLENVNGIDVDEAVITTAPLYKQLMSVYAEEAATEDAIYYMGEALRHGVIDLEVFLKNVRQLSRKQFILRATMHKCRQKAGLRN